ncbi:hypothetical protein BP6252_03451 [Coleophoma cylindrospora]|uniref:Uncharacterized protein n=1 Tax=Coleophoma cylindrospora TaxID=1849047 RepID=A0A3D8S7Q3_9HELO|nr:hypothetical protein BP6252_03451 [Coleophoma cylindrospora]
MSQFSLSVLSYTPPTLPDQPIDIQASDFRSPHLPSIVAATSRLLFTISLPSARANDPLYPATHLQLTYTFEGTGEIFIPNVITSKDLIESSAEGETNLYNVQVPEGEIPRPKVNHGTTSTAEVSVYAWRREKLLGKWNVGQVKGLGIVGLKSEPIHILRQKAREHLRGEH